MEKTWRETLTSVEIESVIQMYEKDFSIQQIHSSMSEEHVTQKAIRDVIAENFGEQADCENCGETLHVAFKKYGELACTECGKVKMKLI